MVNFYRLLTSLSILLTIFGVAASDSVAAPPDEWKYVSDFEMPDPARDTWWRGFADPVLDSLVAIAAAENYDIRVAARRMEIARLSIKQAESAYWPVVSASAGWNHERASGLTTDRFSKPGTAQYYSLGAQLSWEIDVFGKIRSNVKAAKAAASVTKAEYASGVLSVCAQVADSYIALRSAQMQLNVAQELLKAQQEVVHIAEVRHEVSLASGLDVSQAKSVYYSTQASIPALQTTIDQTINSIVVLLGDSGEQWRRRLATSGHLPFFTIPFDKEITGDMLRRRPDVIAAEYDIAHYAALAGVAKKDFLPSLSLTASAGSQARSLGDIFQSDAFTFSVTPTLSWTIFSGFSRRYALAEAREQMMEGVDNYKLVLLNASTEVNNAIVAYRNSVKRTAMLSQVLSEAMKSLDFSIDLYKQGLSPFNNVMDSQVDVLNYNNQLIAEKATAQQAVIALYKALGGGWTE